MRLINVQTLQLQEFVDDRNAPKYAILSHRWEHEELTFKDLELDSARSKRGFLKVFYCCKQAAQMGLSHVWVDTCCIDKNSSAELSEAINSMYRWYQNAEICYAYFSDVKVSNFLDAEEVEFKHSIWFERGWTLQELIAPRVVELYDCSWQCFGTKRSLSDAISDITKIPGHVLQGGDPREYSIAQRMSWAADRKTTRIEDRAYSLIGLFDVNMPMLYGEGEKAFMRLQEEIIKYSSDESIFAWPGTVIPDEGTAFCDLLRQSCGGLLAKSPAFFTYCGNVELQKAMQRRQPFSLTNLGISIELNLHPYTMDTYLAELDCYASSQSDSAQSIRIFLRQTDQDGQYVRVHINKSHTSLNCNNDCEARKLRVNVHQNFQIGLGRRYHYAVRFSESPIFEMGSDGQPLSRVFSYSDWNPLNKVVTIPDGVHGTAVVLHVRHDNFQSKGALLKLGFDFDFNPMLLIRESIRFPSVLRVDDLMNSQWISDSKLEWKIASKVHDSRQQNISNSMRENMDVRCWAVQGHRIYGMSIDIPELNACIRIHKLGSLYEKYWTIDLQRLEPNDRRLLSRSTTTSAAGSTPINRIETIERDDLCVICHLLLHRPMATLCQHTVCESCMVQWADISISSSQMAYLPLDFNEIQDVGIQPNGLKTKCPVCRTTTTASADLTRQRALQNRYPIAYRQRVSDALIADKDEETSSFVQTLALYIGNTHHLTPDESVSTRTSTFHSDLEHKEVSASMHAWTFFVRPSRTDIIETVQIFLHPTFHNPQVTIRHPPYEIERLGWGYFTITVNVTLKAGYSWVTGDADEEADGIVRDKLVLDWTLDFEGPGSQGRWRVKVKKMKAGLEEDEARLKEQLGRLRTLQGVEPIKA